LTVHVITWLWGSLYGSHYVDRLASGVERNLGNHTFTVCGPPPEDMHLTAIPGCLARLRTFDPNWQRSMGFDAGDKILCLDLDLIVTGSLEPLFNRQEPFVILQGANSRNPCKFNGSVWLLEAGYRPDVWEDFTVAAARKAKFWKYPEDQAWFEHMMPDASAYGPKDGVFAFQKPGWPSGESLPRGARIVAFPGARDPSQFEHLPWVRDHWLDRQIAA
jgi:hypothetical protein